MEGSIRDNAARVRQVFRAVEWKRVFSEDLMRSVAVAGLLGGAICTLLKGSFWRGLVASAVAATVAFAAPYLYGEVSYAWRNPGWEQVS
jgi:hypothetical protein